MILKIKTTCIILFFFMLAACSTVDYTTANYQPGTKADKLVVKKSARKLYAYHDGKVIARYPVALGRSPEGAKHQAGDKRTPEGTYRIDYKNDHSKFHEGLHISYPNDKDLAYAKEHHVSPGGAIEIHGAPNGAKFLAPSDITALDWTDGCIAVSNQAIEQLAELVPNGTQIEIKP